MESVDRITTIMAVNEEAGSVMLDLAEIGHLNPTSSEAANLILPAFVRECGGLFGNRPYAVSLAGARVPSGFDSGSMTCAEVARCGGILSISVTNSHDKPFMTWAARQGGSTFCVAPILTSLISPSHYRNLARLAL